MLFDSPKRKNEDKRKNSSRRMMLITGMAAFCIILLAIGVIVLRPRFTPMSDVPKNDLLYADKFDVYALDFQTGQRSKVTQYTVELPSSSAPSPDGRWVIYFETTLNDSMLILEDRTGQEPLRTLGSFGVFHELINTVSWSPDQQWVALAANPFTSEASVNRDSLEASEIWMVRIPTGEVTRLTSNSYRDSNPAFSPDGTRLAYISAASGTQSIYLMDVATGESRLFTPDYYAESFLWSPDGQWIAYNGYQTVTDDSDHRYLYAIRVDGMQTQAAAVKTKSILIGWKP